MSIKKKKEKKKTLGNFYSPYKSATNQTMAEWYEEYKNDAERSIKINGITYHKIISRADFYIYDEPTLLVDVEPNEVWHIDDTLIDECGREFKIKCFAMMRYSGDLPEWHLKISNILIQGQDYSIGNYLGKRSSQIG